MKRTHTIIIGAGQAGLALSRCLTDRGIEHVLLERGRVAQRWSDRWDSLRLLSPNWMTRLPRWQYRGNDPDGFMKRDEVITFLRRYAASFDAPVVEETTVLEVARHGDGSWRVRTNDGMWLARNVVIATGHCQTPNVPAWAPADVFQLTTLAYRNPAQFPEGSILVVGASASGVQLARELRRAGHDVVLSAGRHTRVPRRYRGRDIHYWLDRTGLMTRALSDMRDPETARREPSLQLVGTAENIDLHELASEGVRLAGRVVRFDGRRAVFANDLADSVADADRQLRRLLARIDRHIDAHGAARHFPQDRPLAPIATGDAPQEHDVTSILWATGYTRSYPWLRAPVLDARGEIIHTRGRTPLRGLYVLGLQFMIRRNSSLIDGVGRDAIELADDIAARAAYPSKEAA